MANQFDVTLRAVGVFFDRQAVIKRVKPATRKALSKAGAFVRRTARQSIRKRKKISAPGSPPSSHKGTLRRLIFFGFDPATESVVVGPTVFGRGEAPAALEHGGKSTAAARRGSRRRRRVVRIRRRPFMRPALEREAGKFPDLWRNSVSA